MVLERALEPVEPLKGGKKVLYRIAGSGAKGGAYRRQELREFGREPDHHPRHWGLSRERLERRKAPPRRAFIMRMKELTQFGSPDATLNAFLEHGSASETVELDVDSARETVASLESAGISMDAVTAKLLVDGVKAFADSYDQLLANIDLKLQRLVAAD